MIQAADTIEKYKRCLEFLEKFDYKTLPYSILFFKEDKGEIISVGGYHRDWGAMIEPLYSEDSLRGVRATIEMYFFMSEYLKRLGHLIVRIKTHNEKVIKMALKRFKFKKQEDITYLAKEL